MDALGVAVFASLIFVGLGIGISHVSKIWNNRLLRIITYVAIVIISVILHMSGIEELIELYLDYGTEGLAEFIWPVFPAWFYIATKLGIKARRDKRVQIFKQILGVILILGGIGSFQLIPPNNGAFSSAFPLMLFYCVTLIIQGYLIFKKPPFLELK